MNAENSGTGTRVKISTNNTETSGKWGFKFK